MIEVHQFMNPVRGFVCVTDVTHVIPVVAINKRVLKSGVYYSHYATCNDFSTICEVNCLLLLHGF